MLSPTLLPTCVEAGPLAAASPTTIAAIGRILKILFCFPLELIVGDKNAQSLRSNVVAVRRVP